MLVISMAQSFTLINDIMSLAATSSKRKTDILQHHAMPNINPL